MVFASLRRNSTFAAAYPPQRLGELSYNFTIIIPIIVVADPRLSTIIIPNLKKTIIVGYLFVIVFDKDCGDNPIRIPLQQEKQYHYIPLKNAINHSVATTVPYDYPYNPL